MMDNDSVAMFLPEEAERKRKSCKPGRRFFCILALVAFITLTVLFGIVLSISVTNTNRYESLKKQYDDLRNSNEGKIDYSGSNIGLKSLIDHRINDSEFTWKRKLNARFDSIDNNLRIQVKADKKLRFHMNNSFENITNDLDNLISTIDNLTLSLLRINTTSDHKILHLRNILKDVKGDLSQTRTALNKINGSLRNDLTHINSSFSVAVKFLKKELDKLSSLTTANNNELLEYLNQTNTEFQQALEQMSHQNTTLHLTVEYHSKALYYEVKMVEKKLALLSKNTTIVTTKDKQDLEKVLNDTRRSLQETFRNQISRTSTGLSKKIENFETQLRSSLANVTTKIDAVKVQLRTNITNLKEKQQNIKDDLSETKLNFQVVDSRHETNISALADKIQSITNTYVHLRDNLDTEKDKRLKLEKDLQDLRRIVDKHLNSASGILGINTPLLALVLVFLVSVLMYF